MVFSPVNSFIINMGGMLFTVMFRYFTGVQMGEGFWNGVLKKNPYVNSLFEVDARGNPLVLFALRFVWSGYPMESFFDILTQARL